MKKVFALLLTLALLACVMCVSVFASGDVASPEKPNVDPDPDPVSPATGLVLSVAGASAIALASGSVVVLSLKKANKNH